MTDSIRVRRGATPRATSHGSAEPNRALNILPDNVYAVSEIVGSSTEGVDDAIRGAIDGR